MVIYSYSKCSTCRKAINWLRDNSLEFDLINIIDTPPSRDLLVEASKKLGGWKYLFNTSGLSYRKLGAAVVKGFKDDEAFDALVADPKLIKRPFLIYKNSNFLVGFKEDIWISSLLKK